VIKAKYEESATIDVQGDLNVGGVKTSSKTEKRTTDPITNLYTPYKGSIQDFQVNGIMSHPLNDAVESVGVTFGECTENCDP